MAAKKGVAAESPVGKMKLDATGSPVVVVRMDAAQTYVDVPDLLKSVIDESSADAWRKIKDKIDYIHANLCRALDLLDKESNFSKKVKSEIKDGKRLLFKPNLVMPASISPVTHGEDHGNSACTEWPFIAALMRWFHDNLDIPYNKMTIGEAASAMSMVAGYFSLAFEGGRRITTESVIEGRSGDFYGGWGFYFVRKYLAENHPPAHEDNPMNGYEESVSGLYLPPGRAGNRLIVYDLNRTYDLAGKEREVNVPGGANFSEIILHKVITGGDPSDPDDLRDYPGCVLVNVPRCKIHAIDLITNAIKNLGIGLYPMEASSDGNGGSTKWKYCYPHKAFPGMKTEIPHQVWMSKTDFGTGLPVRDGNGQYIMTRTAGISGTQADVISAVKNLGVFMLHVVDGIQMVNINHEGTGTGVKVAEGLALAALDPVALDLACARYMFKTVPMAEARKLKQGEKLPTDFLQRVPIVKTEGPNMVSEPGIDSPLLRYKLYSYAESRGLGQQKYYMCGWDDTAGAPIASVEGHMGRLEGGKFCEIMTGEFYHNPRKMLWVCQNTVLSYFKAYDSMAGSTYYRDTLAAFDENGDGVIDYDEMGRTGFWHPMLRLGSYGMHLYGTEKYGFLHGMFLMNSRILKYLNPPWNEQGHDFAREYLPVVAAAAALRMSQVPMDSPDPFFPAITWGNGKWPSVPLASYLGAAVLIYGTGYPLAVDLHSLYGYAFQYADKTLNGASYTGSHGPKSKRDAADRYIEAVAKGARPLDYVFYVPATFGSVVGRGMPNVEETNDPQKVLTASFAGGKEIW